MEYKSLAELYEKLFSTSKRLEKTNHIALFLKKMQESKEKSLDYIFLLLRGRVFPDWDDSNIGFAAKMAVKAISQASGISTIDIEKSWKKTGDLGLTAQHTIEKKKQVALFTESLTIEKVYNNILKLAKQEGQGSANHKTQLVAELLTSASAIEAKYIVRLVLEDMRVGIGDSTIRDAMIWSLNQTIFDEENNIHNREEYSNLQTIFQEAYDISNDWSTVFQKAQDNKLHEIELTLNRPVKVMLFPKALDIKEAFERLGKPCAFEFKYDGFRVEIHREENLLNNESAKVTLYTRRLEDVTNQFPDVVDVIKKNVKGSCILDAEIIGIDVETKRFKPFQEISQRIKRKHGIHEMIKTLPVEIDVFDILYHEGKSLIKEQFIERRKIIESIVIPAPAKINLAKQLITASQEEAEEFFNAALEQSNEGLMAKKLDAPYKPGARVGHGMKIKAMKESLDLVIVKAEYGEGKRAGWLSSFTVACIDEDGSFLEIGKVSTGLKEKTEEGVSFEQLTKQLTPLIIAEQGKEVLVKPNIIIEVGHEEIQRSPTYQSGFALRFPRFLQLREDKSLDEISNIDYVEKLFKDQK